VTRWKQKGRTQKAQIDIRYQSVFMSTLNFALFIQRSFKKSIFTIILLRPSPLVPFYTIDEVFERFRTE
jgi:hypothetical protein